MTRDSDALTAILQAAEAAPWVLARRNGDGVEVVPWPQGPGDAALAASGGADTVTALLSALQLQYGRLGARTAQQDLGLRPQPGRPLLSRTVRDAEASAAAVSTLQEGQGYALRIAHSAVLGGRGYALCCQRCGVDPQALPRERREAIDAQMALHFRAEPDPRPDEVAGWLCALLAQRAH